MVLTDIKTDISAVAYGMPSTKLRRLVEQSLERFAIDTHAFTAPATGYAVKGVPEVEVELNDARGKVIAISEVKIADQSISEDRFMFWGGQMRMREPDIEGLMTCEAAYIPEITEQLPDDFRQALTDLAMEAVLMTVGGNWFNPQLAQFHRMNYNTERTRIRAELFMQSDARNFKSALI